jgi:hypothetical protein
MTSREDLARDAQTFSAFSRKAALGAAGGYSPRVLYVIEHAAGVALDPRAQSYAQHQARLRAHRVATVRAFLELLAMGFGLTAGAARWAAKLRRRAAFVVSALNLGARPAA